MDETGRSVEDVLADIDERRRPEPDVHAARLFGLVYPSGDEELEDLARAVSERYLFGNALNPFRFPSLADMERDVVAGVGDLVHLPSGGGGSMTSGGTESILMSMLVNRERARRRGVEHPTIVAPYSAHPAYAKAAHFLGMGIVTVPLGADHRADVAAARGLVDDDTAVIVASAFSYPYGIVDPVEELAGLAAERGVACHVDGCIGGFVLPFLEDLGRPVPPWDFRVEGVTEISADIHKYGYTPKGASVILHRDPDWRDLQWFLYDAWPSGIYGSPAVAGARPAAPVAIAWATMQHLGRSGYRSIARTLLDATDTVRSGIEAIDGLDLVGDPVGPVMAIEATDPALDIFAIGDDVDSNGWFTNRNTTPLSLHVMLSPAHAPLAEQLVADIAAATERNRAAGANADQGGEGRQVRYS
ncbi:MAG: pyridoxal phosphate-dependent decarboxylase family protein [Acidimicrobiales bacterium]